MLQNFDFNPQLIYLYFFHSELLRFKAIFLMLNDTKTLKWSEIGALGWMDGELRGDPDGEADGEASFCVELKYV